MKEYISKTVKIERPSEQIYGLFSDLSLFANTALTQNVKEIENVTATADTCLFKVKGIETGLQIIDREPFKTVKYTGYGSSPFDFFLWVQFKEIAPYDTRMRIVLRVKMNKIMEMMLNGKIAKGLDSFSEQMADSLNGKYNNVSPL